MVGAVFFAPFAEELNRSRRMTTLTAEALAAAGIATLVFDYSGTGDSSGDFGDIRWETWVDDGIAAIEWMAEETGAPVTLVGLRLGAPLAVQCATGCADRVGSLVLWQPVASGKNLLTQFLRIRIASALGSEDSRETTATLRERFAAGETLEIGGYDIAPELALALDRISLSDAPPPRHIRTAWLEVAGDDSAELMAASQAVLNRWQEAGTAVSAATVTGEQFWTTQEIATAPALIDATLASIAGARA